MEFLMAHRGLWRHSQAMDEPVPASKSRPPANDRQALEDRARQIGMMFRLSRSTRLQPYLLLIALVVMFGRRASGGNRWF